MNSNTATASFRYRFLGTLSLPAVAVLLVSCSSDGESSNKGTTSQETSDANASSAKATSTASVPSNVANAIDRVTSKPRYEHSSWGISVRDLSTGEVLLGRSGGKMFVPASTFKTFSGATVLDGYGPDYRFKTPVYRTGALKKVVVEGDLVMVASGDLSLGLREKPDGTMAFANAPNFDHTYANTAPQVDLVGDPLTGLDKLEQQAQDGG